MKQTFLPVGAETLAAGLGDDVCPICLEGIQSAEIGAGEIRLMNHLAVSSAKEYAGMDNAEDPKHCTPAFWIQMRGIEKMKIRNEARSEARPWR